MEVHHHPHVEKKNFKEYFLEFLMIFLAVTLGFFAENIREHFVNKEKERQYIRSFIDDMSDDEYNLPKLINNIEIEQIEAGDSLPILLSRPDTKSHAFKIYLFLRRMIRQQGVKSYITDRTFEQVKNAGEMRLISNKQISDSLVDYYKAVEYIEDLQQTLKVYKEKLREDFPLILNSTEYAKAYDNSFNNNVTNPNENFPLGSVDPMAINRILIATREINVLSKFIKNRISYLDNKAGNIKKLIAKEYDLKK